VEYFWRPQLIFVCNICFLPKGGLSATASNGFRRIESRLLVELIGTDSPPHDHQHGTPGDPHADAATSASDRAP
jgi:hypothetical protein